MCILGVGHPEQVLQVPFASADSDTKILHLLLSNNFVTYPICSIKSNPLQLPDAMISPTTDGIKLMLEGDDFLSFV